MQVGVINHQELVARHRERYRVDAQAALDGLEEIRVRDDCGVFPRPVDHKFIDGMESHLPPGLYGDDCRRILCERIASNEPVPELDRVLSAYVTRLTGKPADA
jgi:hypothetical protein